MLYTVRICNSFQFIWKNSIPFTSILIHSNGLSPIHIYEFNESQLFISNYEIEEWVLIGSCGKSESCVAIDWNWKFCRCYGCCE